MEGCKYTQLDEFKRLVAWSRDNNIDWFEVIEYMADVSDVDLEKLGNIILELKNNSFYQVVYMILCSVRTEIREAVEKTNLSMIINDWNLDKCDDYINDIAKYLKEEEEQRYLRK